MTQKQLPIVEDFFIECVAPCCDECHVSSEYGDVPETLQGCLDAGWTCVVVDDDEWRTHYGDCPACSIWLTQTTNPRKDSTP